MLSFLENKIACAAIVSSFAIAFAWNVTQGVQPIAGHLLFPAQAVRVAHGPMIPPDPWEGTTVAPIIVAHGPMIPPDPWEGTTVAPVTLAHGPMIPPDPWEGTTVAPITVAHGPMIPPDPWEGTTVALTMIA